MKPTKPNARHLLIAASLGLLLANSAHAEPADPAAGKALHDANCTKCHNSSVYTRPDRRVKNLGALNNQVQRCEQMLKLQWFDDDIENVAAYLNQQFYKY